MLKAFFALLIIAGLIGILWLYRKLGSGRASGAETIAGVVDVETTGLDPATDELIEIAIILFTFRPQNGELIHRLDSYVGLREPTKAIPPEATAIHGLTARDVAGKSLDLKRLKSLIQQAEFLIAHNAEFDQGFLAPLLPSVISKTWLCSMRGINWYEKGYSSQGLQNLLAAHSITVARQHRAYDDANAMMRLLTYPGANGITYLYELLNNSHPRTGKVAQRSPKFTDPSSRAAKSKGITITATFNVSTGELLVESQPVSPLRQAETPTQPAAGPRWWELRDGALHRFDQQHGSDLMEYGDIIQDLQRAIEMGASKSAKAQMYRTLGEIYHRCGCPPMAIKYFELALNLNPQIGVKKVLASLKADHLNEGQGGS